MRLAGALSVLLLAAVTPVLAGPAAAPAGAASTYLCGGYSGCASRGMGSGGYAQNSGTMYWRMYSGHNCTNYVAYRVIQAGGPKTRPWSGNGNATNWGRELADITDSRPAVGAVAWWKRGTSGGSSGHVAWVEEVVSATEIVVSEDSWGGDFDWRRITKTGSSWPDGFIHLVDKTVENVTAPTVIGNAQVGAALGVSTGSWTPSPRRFAFQWYADGQPIDGATRRRLPIGPELAGTTVGVRVTARKPGHTAGAANAVLDGTVDRGDLVPAAAPVVDGDTVLGQDLVATPGGWSPTPEISVWRWKADGVNITGQTQPRLRLTEELLGKSISVVHVVRRDGYRRGTAFGEQSLGPVVAGVVEFGSEPTVRGRRWLGKAVAVSGGETTPADATTAVTWLRDGEPIPGANARRYEPTAQDVGRALSVRMAATKESWRGALRTVDVGTVSTKADVRAKAAGRSRAAVVVVRATAAGLGRLSGPVTVRIGRNVVEGELVDGAAKVRVEGLAPGTRRVLVKTTGTDAVRQGRTAFQVRVKR